MKEKYEELWDICTGKPSSKVTETNRKHIKQAVKEIDAWCDSFVRRLETAKEKKEMYANMAADKPISTIASLQAGNEKVFKGEKEAKEIIMTRWFSCLLRYRLPIVHDGSKLRTERRKLLREMEKGCLATTASSEALNRCLERIKGL